MSFLDRIKGTESRNTTADPAAAGSFDDRSGPASNPMEATARLGHSTLTPPHMGRMEGTDSSIISEASPSELATEFNEANPARQAISDVDGENFNSGLPVVGAWPLGRQQRAMLSLFIAGLALLLLVGVLSLYAGSRSNLQVAAAAQATTQSQRLAKSITL
ncbi:MAG TPA: methyl-accepting chemotaxis protein, partial [Rubrivivax sp.]|nr:methyl-accepting chemotaxis protein [Rubrivivax sp.]